MNVKLILSLDAKRPRTGHRLGAAARQPHEGRLQVVADVSSVPVWHGVPRSC